MEAIETENPFKESINPGADVFEKINKIDH